MWISALNENIYYPTVIYIYYPTETRLTFPTTLFTFSSNDLVDWISSLDFNFKHFKSASFWNDTHTMTLEIAHIVLKTNRYSVSYWNNLMNNIHSLNWCDVNITVCGWPVVKEKMEYSQEKVRSFVQEKPKPILTIFHYNLQYSLCPIWKLWNVNSVYSHYTLILTV